MNTRIGNGTSDGRHAGLRRLAILVAAAVAAFLMLSVMSNERDWSGVTQARAMRDAARVKRADVEQRIERHPHAADVEPDAAAGPRLAKVRESSDGAGSPDSQDPLWQLALAAHEQGLHIRHLAPAPGGVQDAGNEAEPRYDIAGDGRIGAIAGWVRALAALPLNVAPVRLDIERQAAGATFSARLAVSPGAAARGQGALMLPDPFDVLTVGLPADADFGGREAAPSPRLAGIVGNARHALAVFDAESGPWCAAPGERIGGERIARIDGGGVWFGSGDGREHRVMLAGEGQS
ncbi:hypothetical protein [Burkholderia sp. 3C]